MTVGGLAHHLTDQAADSLSGCTPTARRARRSRVLEHYRRGAWANTGLDDEDNVGIRDGRQRAGRGGPDALADQVRADLAALPAALAARRERRRPGPHPVAGLVADRPRTSRSPG